MDNWNESSHMSSSVFNSLRLEGKLCDAVIKVEDVTFEIHRVILCRCSTYFLDLWSQSPPDKKLFHPCGTRLRCCKNNQIVYICGGFNGTDFLQTAEFYSPETNQWTMISQMSCQRRGLGIVAYADHVYAVGGFDGSVRLSSAEVYNPRSDTWRQVSRMLTARSNFGIEVLNGRLYVVGGYNGRSTCTNVEYYDATTDEWTEASPLDISRSAVSCCVLSGLPNMDEYVSPRDSLTIVSLDDVFVDSEDSSEHS
ncbi:uncharacterized protein LOC142949872 [Anarhichas minor]|uniref:uncharacterized protein LOC142949872 n=1 Tax=Anarhichas minor TaxID=65739 RepID=UPI003F740328